LTILQLKNTDRYDTAVAPSFMMKQVSHTRLLGLGYRGNPRSSTPITRCHPRTRHFTPRHTRLAECQNSLL